VENIRESNDMKTEERRQHLKEALINAAQRRIEIHGLAGLKARDLAAEVGCAVGAIYNVVSDLDDLVLAVNERTLIALEAKLEATMQGSDNVAAAIKQMVWQAHVYLDFAAAHTKSWRAVFDHNLPQKKVLPDGYSNLQQRLFSFIEQPLRTLQPGLSNKQFALLARSLFSAVHGIVELGLKEKLVVLSLREMKKQLTKVLTALGKGLASQR
jgi:AcrR family transcriptional regulator